MLKLFYMGFLKKERGFALPTVVIASLILMMVLAAALSTTTSTRTALEEQYYNQLSREAAEAGIAYAQGCMDENDNAVTWTGTSGLYPGSGCYGSASCTYATCYLYKNSQFALSFNVETVGSPVAGVQTLRGIGTVSLFRAGTDTVVRSSSYSLIAKTGSKLSVRNIVSGYSQFTPKGSFFGVVDPSGVFMTTGQNNYGQLGTGTANSLMVTPQKFIIPSGEGGVVAGFANNLSTGKALFALTSNGNAYAAGHNNRGQLGVGSASSSVATPQKVAMPVGKKIRSITTSGDVLPLATGVTYFVTTDNEVYSAGYCDPNYFKTLGYNCTSDQYTPKLVTFPATGLNAQATNNVTTDRHSAFVRMAGGAVYGWGYNDWGQLGIPSWQGSAIPVKIGTFGDAGSPKAVSAIYSDSLYVLDDQGAVWAMGDNSSGQLGTRTFSLTINESNLCLDVNVGGAPALGTCSGSAKQKVTLRADGTVYNASIDRCLTVNADNVWMSYAICAASPGASQKWTYSAASTFQLKSAINKCLDTPDRVSVYVTSCVPGSNPWWYAFSNTLNKISIPGSSKIIKIASDEAGVTMLTADGKVWSVGRNSGSFGNGSTALAVYEPTQFILPAGEFAKDIGLTWAGDGSKNLYVVTAQGKVYGAGDNNYGQLGNCQTSATPVSTPVQMMLLVSSAGYTPCVPSALAAQDLSASSVITAGGTTLVLTESNLVYSVGNNSSGQLGDGTTINSSEPKARTYLNTMPQIIY